jgi:uncharacterized membrane protein YphA (DoxX/SURF4 family)
MRDARGRYWLARFVLLRLLGVVYAAAFLCAALQVVPLIGRDGLLPAGRFLDRVAAHFGSRAAGFLELPSLFWLDASDRALLAVSWAGVALALVVVAGFANALVCAALWALYMSIVHVGQDWYGYGWEIQLLETGFLAIFLCPLLDARPFPRRPPPAPVVWCLRWLVFRIMLGAGLIKLRGDPCWRDLTCLDYHYETQPIPNPLSRWFHRLPHPVQAASVVYNHVTEVVAPWFLAWPRALRLVAGGLMLVFQLTLIASGNLSFLNWLTIVPIVACFDDAALGRVLPRRLVAAADAAAARAMPSRGQTIAAWAVLALIAVLSVNPVANLLARRQVMNGSFDRLDLVNTYGAFGTVGRERDELVFEGTDAEDPSDEDAVWRAYEFPCKPGDPARRPCVVAPLQPRLTWQLWFAAMSTPDRYPWTIHLVWKLLHDDPSILTLVERNPFPDRPPRWIRVTLWRYTFAPPGSGRWWDRTLLGEWLPPLSVDDPRLVRAVRRFGWTPPVDAGEPGE